MKWNTDSARTGLGLISMNKCENDEKDERLGNQISKQKGGVVDELKERPGIQDMKSWGINRGWTKNGAIRGRSRRMREQERGDG